MGEMKSCILPKWPVAPNGQPAVDDFSAMNDSVKDYKRWDVPHPMPYQGSKRSLAPLILSYFPAHVSRLIEPFAGSAAISLAAARLGRAEEFLINDAHGPVADLWRAIIEHPESLARRYRTLWEAQLGREREYYDVVRKRFNETHKPAYFLYLLARCVKAAIRYNGRGEFNNSPDNRRKGAHPGRRCRRASWVHPRCCAGERRSARRITGRLSKAAPSDDLIYLDPPYQGVCRNRDNRYCPRIDHEEFCDSLDALNRKGCRYVVSYDGRTGEKTYGEPLPKHLHLAHIEVHAGRSTQATLLGRDHDTYESLYLSPALAKAAGNGKRKMPQMEFAW